MDNTASATMRTALYAGSFNPFTAGHEDIARRALAIFGRLVIAVGTNMAKTADSDIAARLEAIRRVFRGDSRVEVIQYSGLTAPLAASLGAVMVRGVRNTRDFEYERDMADINRRLSGVDTVVLFASPALGAVSSSLVRELEAFGADTSQFMPN